MNQDELIEQLAGELRPVRRLPSPVLRAALWLAVVLAVGLVLCRFADLSALLHRMVMVPDLRWATVGAVLTAIGAAVAAFQASVPGRSDGWVLLPLPSLVLWLAASSWGCMRPPPVAGMYPATMAQSMKCVVFILLFSIPLSALLVVLLRRAAPLRPRRVAALGGLAAAAGAASLLTLFHPEDVSVIDLAMHAAAVALVVVANEIWSGRFLHKPTVSP